MEIKEHSFYEADNEDSPSRAFMENEDDEEEKLSESQNQVTIGQTVSGIDNMFNSELGQTPYDSKTKLSNVETDVKIQNSDLAPESFDNREREMARKEMNFRKKVSWPEM